jgi:hypothetical protein
LCHSGCPLLVLDGAGGNMVTWGSGNWTRCVVSADVEMLIGDSESAVCPPACLRERLHPRDLAWIQKWIEMLSAALQLELHWVHLLGLAACGRVQLFLFCSISYRSTVPFDGLMLVVAVTLW